MVESLINQQSRVFFPGCVGLQAAHDKNTANVQHPFLIPAYITTAYIFNFENEYKTDFNESHTMTYIGMT